MSIRSKKDLEIVLSKLKNYENPSFQLEQYPTPSHIAAEWVWNMAMAGEVVNKTILDAACGPGIIGLGLLLLGAKHVIFVDKDPEAMQICQHNYAVLAEEYELGKAEFIISDIQLVDVQADSVVQNPPFGTKNEHIDKIFLEKAFTIGKIVYSMHKYSTKRFVEAVAKDHHFKITHLWQYEFPIKATFAFHEKPVKRIDVGLWRMEKQ
ncbi:methyltransferase [Candidatus Woesearchaeota archaeon]|nr:methyltransferase [Candidatus Woesearchaeota archaeon]